MNGGFQFEFAKVPVRVLWMFVVVAVLFGYRLNDPLLIAVWVAIMFASILLHELGHALVYRRFGVQPSIVLHGFGGTTSGRSLPVGKDLLVTLAGPFAGLAVGLPLLYVSRTVPIHDALLANALSFAIFINVWWSVLNLLPMMPLDGGNATNAILSLVLRRDMTRVTHVISVVTAAAAIAYSLQNKFLYGALLAGYFLYLNVMSLRSGPTVGRFQPTITGPTTSSRSPTSTRPRRGRSRRSAPPPDRSESPPRNWTPAAPERPPVSPISTVGWARPVTNRRSFADEVHTASQALARDEPELAAIAVDRARRLATGPDELTVTEQLQAEVDRRISG